MGQCGGGATLVLAVHHRVAGAGLRHRGQARAGPITGIVYSLGQGALVGSISKIYETFYEGIVFLALTATIAVFVGALLLYIFRIIKVTQKTRSVIIIATVGIGLFYLGTLLLSLFNINVPLVTGVGTGALVFSILVVIVAALNLLLDFGDRARHRHWGAEGVLVVRSLRSDGDDRLALHRDSPADRHRRRPTGIGLPGEQTGAHRGTTSTTAR